MEAAGYRDLDAPQLLENGPYAYSYRLMYLAWSCNTRTHKLQLGGETATWAYAFVNHLTWFVEPQKTLRIQGQPTYFLTKRLGSFRAASPSTRESTTRNPTRVRPFPGRCS